MATEGTQFGRYLLQRRIATGGMAEIFLAKQQGPGRFERTLVIKRILPHLAQDPKFIGMFLDEAALAAQLSHPHIAQVYDFGDEGGQYYLALELVRGPDLASVIDACRRLGKPPPADISVRLVSQMLEALHYAHGAADEQGRPLRLVHRDISPQNALCSLTGVLKLIDFGIAKAASAMQRTDAGMVKGKFTYMAPEQLRGEPLDGRCDMYASALVLYELLSLQVAIQGDGPAAISNAMEARIAPLQELRPDLTPDLFAVVGRALKKNRDERFRDCAEFGGALEKVLASQGAMVQAPQIAEYLKSLEVELGAPLSPVGLGSSSGEKVPPTGERLGSGPHDTKISGSSPERPDALDTAMTEKNLPASPPGLKAPKRSRAGVWVALGVLIVAGVAGAAGWRVYSANETSKAMAEVVPEAAPVDAPLPPVPAVSPGHPAPAPEKPAVIAKVEPVVQPPPPAIVERHPNSRAAKRRAKERLEREAKGDRREVANEPVAGVKGPPPSAPMSPASPAPKPNYQQVPPPNYQQQAPYYQNGYYQNQYQQPQYGQPQQPYPYGQQQPYQYPQQGYQR